MNIVFAAIGGPEVEAADLSAALDVLARGSDLEEVASTFDICFRSPWTGERSAWCDVELRGGDAASMLVDAARAIAAHTQKPVRAVASGVERQINAARVEIGYRAYEVMPDGTSRSLSFAEADEACGEVCDDHPTDALGRMLALLVDGEPPFAHRTTTLDGAGNPGRCFRRKVLLDDPRLARLAAAILAAKAVSFAPDPSGRVRLKIDASDGGKQISFVSADEAATLQRATNRI